MVPPTGSVEQASLVVVARACRWAINERYLKEVNAVLRR